MNWSIIIEKKCRILFSPFRRVGLKNRTFSILSNNCWGGAVYDTFHLPYRTPTIGMWMHAKDYVRFLSDLTRYLQAELRPVDWRESHVRELLADDRRIRAEKRQPEDWILGRLDDVDIVFQHYASFDEAAQKWNYRKARLNFDNLLVKFNDQNGFSPEDYEAFAALPFAHKLFFTARREYAGQPGVVCLEDAGEDGGVRMDTMLSRMPFDVKALLNGMMDGESFSG